MTMGKHAMPEAVRQRLWREAESGYAYAVLDSAQIDNLLELLYAPGGPAFECLWAGELEPDMASVAPYLVQLHKNDAFTAWLLNNAWGLNWGIYLISDVPMPMLWRHLRPMTKVYGPSGESIYFRFYDPRVLLMISQVMDGEQVAAFLGPVKRLLVEGVAGNMDAFWAGRSEIFIALT